MNLHRHSTKLDSLRPLLYAGLFMLVGILFLIYLGRDTARLMNAKLEDVDIHPLLSSESHPTVESLRGKISVFHFWGTWCGPCRHEFPEFVELYRRHVGRSEIQFLSVSCSPGPENDLVQLKEETAEYLRSIPIEMPTYADPAMFTRGTIARMLASGGFSYPFTMILDREGVVRDYWVGATPTSMRELAKRIDQLLEKKAS